MDLKTIEKNIKILESEDTTVENVQDLANLYTVYDRLRYKQPHTDQTLQELNDLMPAFISVWASA